MGLLHLHRQAAGPRILPLLLLLASFGKVQAGCTTAFTVTATPPPAGGFYSCGQTVTFCLTVSGWGVVNNNWLHGVVADFGPGWDMSTLVPGTPPATVGTSGGTWGWYPSVNGTSTSPDNTGAQGPGFFFDLDNNGNPGNNFGDYSTTGPWTFCWTISVLSPPACTPGTDVSVTFSVFSDSQTGSWGSGGCGSATLTTVPAQIGGGCPNAGNDNTLNICGNAPPAALFPLLGAAATGGTWTGPGGIASTGTYNPAVQLPGAYVYTIAASPGCPADQAVITVNEQTPVNAGADGTLSICSSSPPANLFGSLAGAMGGGIWTGPGGAPFNGSYDPAAQASGVYTYTVAGTAPCPNDQATVTVTEQLAPNAGTDGTLAICSNGAATALFPLLAGSTAGGTWTGPGGTPFNGTYDPAAQASGIYTYTVTGTAPCPNDQAIV
ncbi:MAG: hypothetical protein JST66_04090, partial [Bacteroidetes bacterium]|nr:hypothetical protein [Bacteroidota bacterium]